MTQHEGPAFNTQATEADRKLLDAALTVIRTPNTQLKDMALEVLYSAMVHGLTSEDERNLARVLEPFRTKLQQGVSGQRDSIRSNTLSPQETAIFIERRREES
ncbi:MAG: hypothetical protein EBZ48_03240 [Proteobacteria bacterium]|nr:hypothetical protein [Pseudomonadota bacterium]